MRHIRNFFLCYLLIGFLYAITWAAADASEGEGKLEMLSLVVITWPFWLLVHLMT